jgi:glycosyltransferase involved in cell wall biosynthesis
MPSNVMKISVVIPLYNKIDCIEKTVNTIFSQSFQPNEIIIVDDGSTDGSYEKVLSLNIHQSKIIRQNNSGVSVARNKGVEESAGDWIAFLDADDEWMPGYLEAMSNLNKKYPECNILATSYYLENSQKARTEIKLNKIKFTGTSGILDNYFEVASCSHPPLWTSAVVVRKSALLEAGGFPEGVSAGEDLLTWARLALKNKIAYSKIPLSVFIQDPAHTYDNIPNRIPQMPDLVGSQLEKLSDQHSEIKGLKQYVALWFKMRASIFLRLGMRKSAVKQTLNSLKHNPAVLKVWFYLILAFMPLRIINGVFKIMGNR